MFILRRFIIFLAYTLLPTALIAFGVLFSVHQILGSPKHIEAALDQSGIYNSIAATIVQQATSNASSNLDTSGQQAVQNAIGTAMSPDYVKTQTNNALQGIYSWIQGKTTSPSFAIDLSNVKAKLAYGMAQQAEQRAASLPACSPQQLMSIDPSTVDPLTMTCLPPTITPAQVGQQARQQVEASDFYKTGTLTPASLSQNGKSFQQQLQPAANTYKYVSQGLLGTGLAIIVLVAAVILLSRPWQQGAKRLSVVFLSIGITSAALALFAGWLLKTISNKLTNQTNTNAELQSRIVKAIQLLTNDIRNEWLSYGIILAVLGIAGLVVIHFKKASRPRAESGAGGISESLSTPAISDNEHNNVPPAPPTHTGAA